MRELLEFDSHLSFLKVIALISALVGTIFYRKYSHGKAKYFILFLWLVLLTELSYKIAYYEFNGGMESQNFIYNLYDLLQLTFVLFWYRYLIKSPKIKKLLLLLFLIYFAFFVFNSIFYQDLLDNIQYYNTMVSTVLIVITILLYFKEVLEGEFILRLNRSVYFWFSFGLLMINLPMLPLVFMAEYLGYTGVVYETIIFIINVLMHSCFIVGILWSQKRFNA